jgi:hypothetical protein
MPGAWVLSFSDYQAPIGTSGWSRDFPASGTRAEELRFPARLRGVKKVRVIGWATMIAVGATLAYLLESTIVIVLCSLWVVA